MAKRKPPEGMILDYPVVPLTVEEKLNGPHISRFPSRVASCHILDYLKDETKVAEKLPFKSGLKMSQFGYIVRPEYDAFQIFPLMMSLYSCKEANHLQKEAAVALAIHNWYSLIKESEHE